MGISVVCMSQVILCMTLRLRRGWLHLERKGGLWDLSRMQRRYIYIYIMDEPQVSHPCSEYQCNRIPSQKSGDSFVLPNTCTLHIFGDMAKSC